MGGVGGFKRTCKGLFTGFVNQLPELDPTSPAHSAALRFRQGIIPDHMIDTSRWAPLRTHLKLSETALLPT